jgi:hypothetical protein
VKPGRQRRLAAVLREPLEGANERVLREIRREIAVPGHPMHQAIDALDVGVVQRALRGGIAAETSRNELSIE